MKKIIKTLIAHLQRSNPKIKETGSSKAVCFVFIQKKKNIINLNDLKFIDVCKYKGISIYKYISI